MAWLMTTSIPIAACLGSLTGPEYAGALPTNGPSMSLAASFLNFAAVFVWIWLKWSSFQVLDFHTSQFIRRRGSIALGVEPPLCGQGG